MVIMKTLKEFLSSLNRANRNKSNKLKIKEARNTMLKYAPIQLSTVGFMGDKSAANNVVFIFFKNNKIFFLNSFAFK